MTTSTNLMPTLAAALGMAAMLAIGGAGTSFADSNDGGPLNKVLGGNAFVGSYAPVYFPMTGTGRTRYVRQNANPQTVAAYDSFGRYLGPVRRR